MRRGLIVAVAVCFGSADALADVIKLAPAGDPTLVSHVSVPTTGAVIRATNGDTEAAVQASAAYQHGNNGLALGLKVTGPISGSSSTPSNLASLDGLANSTTVELAATFMHWGVQSLFKNAIPIKMLCMKYLNRSGCGRSDLTTAEAQREFDKLVDYGHPFLLRLGGRVGYRSIDYLDSQTLAPLTTSGYQWGASAGAGLIIPSWGAFGVVYQRQHALTPQDQSVVCTPLAPVGALGCSKNSVGAPVTTNTNLLTAEARVFVGWVALDPSVTVDPSRRITAVTIPFYFLKSEAGGFIAGVSPSWRSDTKELNAVMFVGGSLSLLPAGLGP